jgi:predicted Zn-dependent peptidase
MAFKGTTSRTALDISKQIESVGGHINAYTSKEITAFYVKILKDDVKIGIDILADIVQNSIFNEEELEKERTVILQEISQTNDTPDDLVFDVFQAQCFKDQALGRPVLGYPENVKALKASNLKRYLADNYSADKIVISAAGNIEHEYLVELVDKYCRGMTTFDVVAPSPQVYTGGFTAKEKDIEQHHIVVGFEGLPHISEDKYVLTVLSTILGGGMSSRLFQEVREKRGLVYSILSFTSSYKDTGLFGVYAACEPTKSLEVLEVINSELKKAGDSISEEEVTKAKTQLIASFLMGLENSSARMERLADQLLLRKRVYSPNEVKALIASVDLEKIQCLCQKLFKRPTLAILGPALINKSLFDILT